MPSPKLGVWKLPERSQVTRRYSTWRGGGISPSGLSSEVSTKEESRLSRAGARADIKLLCGSRVLAGDYRYTFVSADQSCHQGGGGARAISEGVSLGCEVSTGWQNGQLVGLPWAESKGWKFEVPRCPNSPSLPKFSNHRLWLSALRESSALVFEARHVAKNRAKCRRLGKRL